MSHAHHFFLPHEPENIDVDAKDELKQTGQGIELGQANVVGVPIACFYKTGTKLSSSLRFVADEIIEYSDVPDLLAKLKGRLTQ